jgi:hypothetical protein
MNELLVGDNPEGVRSLAVRPDDPAYLGFPPMLPIELALHSAPVREICEAYSITKEEFTELASDPLFIRAYAAAKEELQKDGMSFRLKAKVQAEELLKKSWALIHSESTPSNIKADLIKATVRWAGYDAKEGGPAGIGNAFQININLG